MGCRCQGFWTNTVPDIEDHDLRAVHVGCVARKSTSENLHRGNVYCNKGLHGATGKTHIAVGAQADTSVPVRIYSTAVTAHVSTSFSKSVPLQVEDPIALRCGRYSTSVSRDSI